jgi:hypothetical protein
MGIWRVSSMSFTRTVYYQLSGLLSMAIGKQRKRATENCTMGKDGERVV